MKHQILSPSTASSTPSFSSDMCQWNCWWRLRDLIAKQEVYGGVHPLSLLKTPHLASLDIAHTFSAQMHQRWRVKDRKKSVKVKIWYPKKVVVICQSDKPSRLSNLASIWLYCKMKEAKKKMLFIISLVVFHKSLSRPVFQFPYLCRVSLILQVVLLQSIILITNIVICKNTTKLQVDQRSKTAICYAQ